MNKKIIIIDVPWFLLEDYYKVAISEKDRVIFVNKSVPAHLISKYPIKIFDIKTQYQQLKEWIKDEFGTVHAIYSVDERTIIEATKLAAEFTVQKNSFQSVLDNRDKAYMKKLWADNNILTPKAIIYDFPNDIDYKLLNYPLILKPSLGYASSCVVKIKSEMELRKKVGTLILADRLYLTKNSNSSSQIIIEEFIEGFEYSVDSLWYDGEAICHFISSKDNQQGPLFKDRIYISDPTMNDDLKQLIEKSVEEAIIASGYMTGATHVELRIKDGKCYIIESACRPGGNGLLYKIFSDSYEKNIFNMYYKLYVCDTKDEYKSYIDKLSLPKYPINMAFLYFIQHTEKGLITKISGLQEIINRKEITGSVSLKQIGDKLLSQDIDPDYIGMLYANIKGKDKGRDYALNLVDYYDSTIHIECD